MACIGIVHMVNYNSSKIFFKSYEKILKRRMLFCSDKVEGNAVDWHIN